MTTRSRLIVVLAAIAAIAGVWLAVSRTSNFAQPHPTKDASPATKQQVSSSPADLALAREIDRAIDESDSAQARWGVFVVSMNDGRTIYARNSDRLFTPASNMKIYTTAVALDLLGPDYLWRTSVYASRQIDGNGTIDGDLILYGRGAPDLDSHRKDGLPWLVDELYERGLRHVRGHIIGDESYFSGELYGDGWQWNDLQWYFGAQPSALTIDENSIEVTIAPASKAGTSASVVITPNDDYVRLTNKTMTGEPDAPTSIGIIRNLSSNELRVWGEFPTRGRAFSAFLSIHDPAMRAATLFRQALIARGIKVDGEAQRRDARVSNKEKFDPQKSTELAHADSQPLSAIIRRTNKESNNLYAELLLRTLGKEKGARTPEPKSRKERGRGDDELGRVIIKSWLNEHGISANALAIHDGSGLSRLDLVTPESTARLLIAVTKSPTASVFRDSLPVAGRDGTLRGRLSNEAGRVFAKTGSLTYDHSLSGYIETARGEVLVFSILCNDAAGSSHPVRTIDAVVRLLADNDPAILSKSRQK